MGTSCSTGQPEFCHSKAHHPRTQAPFLDSSSIDGGHATPSHVTADGVPPQKRMPNPLLRPKGTVVVAGLQGERQTPKPKKAARDLKFTSALHSPRPTYAAIGPSSTNETNTSSHPTTTRVSVEAVTIEKESIAEGSPLLDPYDAAALKWIP